MRIITVTEPGGPEKLTVAEVHTPDPGPGEVRLRVVAAGVNRADILQRQGYYPPPPGISEVIGLEVSGVVDAVGEGVPAELIGTERVALLAGGGYAEYAIAPIGQVIAAPAGVGLVSAGGIIEVAATVVSNFNQALLREGETLLLHGGAGGIGTFGIQYAKALGARVITTAGTEAKRQLCLDLGAETALDYHQDWAAAVKAATGGKGVDVILDIMGGKYLEANVSSLARGGRLVVIGLQGGRKGTLDLNRLLSKAASVSATSLRFRPVAEKAAICAELEQRVWPLIAAGTIKPVPEQRFSFAEAAAAHRYLESGENTGKVILTL
jgi:putative PIG3 family NAD(P)H quinone oxidoreductase